MLMRPPFIGHTKRLPGNSKTSVAYLHFYAWPQTMSLAEAGRDVHARCVALPPGPLLEWTVFEAHRRAQVPLLRCAPCCE